MPRINLLPVKAARRRDSARNEMMAMVGVVALVFALLFSWYGAVESEVSTVRANIAQLNVEIGSLRQQVKQVESLQAQEIEYKKKVKVVERLLGSRSGPAQVLYEITQIVTTESKRVWLTALIQHEENKLKLTGGAMDMEDVSEFQLALERRPVFDKVQLLSVKTDSKDNVNYLIWQISCEVALGAG